jgi:hypothetical protein
MTRGLALSGGGARGSFPGDLYEVPDPDGFMPRAQIAARVADAGRIGAPVSLGTDVRRLTARDLEDAGISTAIWTTGYRLDHRWIELQIFDEQGFPRNDRGVTDVPGLFFLGPLAAHPGIGDSVRSNHGRPSPRGTHGPADPGGRFGAGVVTLTVAGRLSGDTPPAAGRST